ncbi:hypothetical protein ES703_45285 [subsurface metagenome]
MDAITINKITRVTANFMTKTTPKGKSITGPYWRGFYQENGKVKTVYLGKELPAELELLLNTRFKAPGHRNYSWPGQRA